MPAQAMVVLGVSYAPAPIVAAMAGLIKTVALMPAQAMVVFRISHSAARPAMLLLILIAISSR